MLLQVFKFGVLAVAVLPVSCGLTASGSAPPPREPAAAPAEREPAQEPEEQREREEDKPVSAPDYGKAIDKGTRWLLSQQNPDGGFGPYGEEDYLRLKNASDVGISAFALYGLAKTSGAFKARDRASIARAVDFLLERQQESGGFYDKRDPTLQNYKTSVALLALNSVDRVKYAGPIRKAQAFIKDQQFGRAGGAAQSESVDYGGIGYGTRGKKPDLSNSQYAAEALGESGLSGSDELWKDVQVFVARCQNSDSVDPLLGERKIGTTKDGGFRYGPDQTRGPVETLDDGLQVFSSYGSMTYAGLKTLLYARVKKTDPIAREAFAWISKNFSVRENPGMATRQNPRAGLEGLYYYYHTMAKTLSLYGEPIITDRRGVEHRWAKELGDHLVSLQKKDGFWQNKSDRWWEKIRALDTAYALVALAECQAQLAREKATAAPGLGGGDRAGGGDE